MDYSLYGVKIAGSFWLSGIILGNRLCNVAES